MAVRWASVWTVTRKHLAGILAGLVTVALAHFALLDGLEHWSLAQLFEWRGESVPRISKAPETYDGQVVIKREILPDGRHKLILKDPTSGDFSDRVVAG